MKTQSKREAILDLALFALREQEITVAEYKTLERMFSPAQRFGNPTMPSTSRGSTRRRAIHRWKLEQLDYLIDCYTLGYPIEQCMAMLNGKFDIKVSKDAAKTILNKCRTGYLFRYESWCKNGTEALLKQLQDKLVRYQNGEPVASGRLVG